MSKEGEIGWYPREPSFRKKFEQAVRRGLQHFVAHGDITQVQRLLDEIPDKTTRFVIAKNLATQFPLYINRNGKLGRNKIRSEGFDWSAIDTARLWPQRLHIVEDRFFLLGEDFSAEELIEEVIDALILHRHAIADDQLDRLKSAVDDVSVRRAANADQIISKIASPGDKLSE
jgi:predicted nucleic-acid-binding protein